MKLVPLKNYTYTMFAFKEWDGELLRKEGSNNLVAFDKYRNKENYRIVIKHGKKIIYDER